MMIDLNQFAKELVTSLQFGTKTSVSIDVLAALVKRCAEAEVKLETIRADTLRGAREKVARIRSLYFPDSGGAEACTLIDRDLAISQTGTARSSMDVFAVIDREDLKEALHVLELGHNAVGVEWKERRERLLKSVVEALKR